MRNFDERLNKRRRTSGVEVLSRKITLLELLGGEPLAREAHHLPQMARRGIEVVFLISLVFEQLTTDDKLEHLNIVVPVSMLNWSRWKQIELPGIQMSKCRLSRPMGLEE